MVRERLCSPKVHPTDRARNTRRPKAPAALLALLLTMVACTPIVNQHGHRIDAERLAGIEPGVTTREQVAQMLGSPSATGAFEDRHWYYITQRTEQVSFYQSEITEQDVVMITFDESGVVESVGEKTLDQARAVTPVPDKTRTLGKELSLLEQLVGNIGRFSDRDAPPQP
ncbi:MAG: outer membrane protein assembly factor BamE [Geminicoccaceae bacterium]|nr:outer membrane protein assembly factor BamE [Geminicoccaceae bacterium]